MADNDRAPADQDGYLNSFSNHISILMRREFRGFSANLFIMR
jgi:hypothetical protein